MLKSSFCGWLFGRSPSVGLSAASPRYAVGFPLQSLTWVKGFHCLALAPWRTGCPVPASVSDHSVRLHGRSRTSGRKDKRNTSVRAARKSSPAFVRSRKLTVLPYTSPARISLPWETGVPGSPEGFFFLHPASNLPLTEMTDRAFFPKLIGKTLTKVGGGESKSAKNAKSPPCG